MYLYNEIINFLLEYNVMHNIKFLCKIKEF
jgi:hypothetical protein